MYPKVHMNNKKLSVVELVSHSSSLSIQDKHPVTYTHETLT